MEPRPAPVDLQRRIARIPLEHPRPRGERAAPSWRRWLYGASTPWAASFTAAFASLAVQRINILEGDEINIGGTMSLGAVRTTANAGEGHVAQFSSSGLAYDGRVDLAARIG